MQTTTFVIGLAILSSCSFVNKELDTPGGQLIERVIEDVIKEEMAGNSNPAPSVIQKKKW